ncbi:MAG: hypothetical protein ACXWV5_03000 [Flavitalea sp.]
MRYVLFLLCLFFVSSGLIAQDKIYKKGGEVIKARVIEIGVDEIKYKVFENQDGPVYVIDKDRILKVEFENGKTESYQNALNDPAVYIDQKKKIIKVGFLSPLSGYLPITYEQNIAPGRSFELTAGIIGLGKNEVIRYNFNGSLENIRRNQGGLSLGAGYKFYKLPTFFNRGVRMSHVMQGFYVRPQFTTGIYSENATAYKNNQEVMEKRTVWFGGLTVDIGQQWVFADRFAIDLFIGLGYGFDNIKKDDTFYNYAEDHFPVKLLGDNGLGFTSGFKIGWLLK